MVFVGTSGRCCGARLSLCAVIPTLAKPVPPRISVRTEHADSEAPPGVVWPRQVDTDDAAAVRCGDPTSVWAWPDRRCDQGRQALHTAESAAWPEKLASR